MGISIEQCFQLNLCYSFHRHHHFDKLVYRIHTSILTLKCINKISINAYFQFFHIFKICFLHRLLNQFLFKKVCESFGCTS